MALQMPESEKRYLLLDSNVFIGHRFHLTAPAFQAVERASALGFVRVVVPEVVVREVERKFREQLDGAAKTLSKASLNVAALTGSPLDIPVDANREASAFNARFSEWRTRVGALVPRVDQVPTAKLFERMMSRRRPFQSETDKGAGDALIWEAVLTLDGEVQNLSLVTDNTSDFCDGAKADLHPDLAADLRAREARLKRRMSVKWFKSIDAVREHWLDAELKVWQKEEFIVGARETFLELKVLQTYRAEIADEVRLHLQHALPSEFIEPEIMDLEVRGEPEVTSSSWEADGVVEVRATFTSALYVAGYAHKGDAVALEGRRGYSVDDWDHSSAMAAVSYEGDVEIRVTTLLRMAPREVTGFQVSSVQLLKQSNEARVD